MKPAVRREEIVQLLKYSKDPVTGRFLAERFGVSRQVIVGDIAAIKEKGAPVISTPEGYLYRVKSEVKTVYKCYHTNEQTEEEYRSETYRESVVEGLKEARNMIQTAVGILEGLPDETVWDDEIAEAADNAADFGFTLDNLAQSVERW